MSFTAASLAAARAIRDAFTVVVEVIDALIPAEAIDQAEALAKAEEEREVWEPHDFAACGGDADAGSSHPSSAPSAKQDTAPHTDSAIPPIAERPAVCATGRPITPKEKAVSDQESTEITVYAAMNSIRTGAPRIVFDGRYVLIWPTGTEGTGLTPHYSMSVEHWRILSAEVEAAIAAKATQDGAA